MRAVTMGDCGCRAVLVALLAAVPLACSQGGSPGPTAVEGVPAFAKVSDGLYRGGQPSEGGFTELKRMGIRTVVSLCWVGSDRAELAGTGLQYVQLRFNPLHPEEEDVLAFLKVANDPRNQPVFVHCQHGTDRTGMMVAMYRVGMQGWTPEHALAEMRAMGFNGGWKGIKEYVEHVDVGELKEKLASTRPPQAVTIP